MDAVFLSRRESSRGDRIVAQSGVQGGDPRGCGRVERSRCCWCEKDPDGGRRRRFNGGCRGRWSRRGSGVRGDVGFHFSEAARDVGAADRKDKDATVRRTYGDGRIRGWRRGRRRRCSARYGAIHQAGLRDVSPGDGERDAEGRIRSGGIHREYPGGRCGSFLRAVQRIRVVSAGGCPSREGEGTGAVLDLPGGCGVRVPVRRYAQGADAENDRRSCATAPRDAEACNTDAANPAGSAETVGSCTNSEGGAGCGSCRGDAASARRRGNATAKAAGGSGGGSRYGRSRW